MVEDQVRQEVQKTLDLLAATPQVKPKPFFYTRLRARMQSETNPEHGIARLLHHRLVLAALGIALLVAMNAYSLLHLTMESTAVRQEQAVASFAREYNISYNQY